MKNLKLRHETATAVRGLKFGRSGPLRAVEMRPAVATVAESHRRLILLMHLSGKRAERLLALSWTQTWRGPQRRKK